MDASIRQLIIFANNADENSNVRALLQAFKALQETFVEAKSRDGTETCGIDLYVLCAEVAYKLKQEKIAEECLKMYFSGTPLSNQFLCRAYLCQAQLLAPKSYSDTVGFETSVVYLLKAINFAKDKSRYHFVVYNASVLYWRLARPFLRPGYRGALCQSLSQVVKSLQLIDDEDHEWRASLMICLVEAYLDEGNHKEAASAALSASQFCVSRAPSKFKEVIALQIKHKLVDMNKLSKDFSSVPSFKAFSKLQQIQLAIASDNSKIDFENEIEKLINFIIGKSSTPSLPTSKPASRDRKSRTSTATAVSTVESDASESASVSRSSSGEIQLSELEDVILRHFEVQPQDESEKLCNHLSSSTSGEQHKDRPNLLIEITRLCIEHDLINLAKECFTLLKEYTVEDAGKLLEIEFITCELMVKELGNTEEIYSKKSVQVRLAAIKRMDQALQNAVRSGNPNIIQGACATQWNLCLPLFQRNLRKHVRSALNRVAQVLEDIFSLQVNLRCEIHIELAKCEEAVEQIEAAVRHLNKALLLDENGIHREEVQNLLHRLQISTQLYRIPDRDEDMAAIIIEQASKSPDSGSTEMRRSLLIKAGQTLAPDAFPYVLDSENLLKAKSSLKGNISSTELQAARATWWKKCMKKAPGHLKRLCSENDRERARLWADLTKTARKQQVWDVCRVSATFCLLYDDGRWRAGPKSVTERGSESRKSRTGSSKRGTESEFLPEEQLRSTSDLLRMIAEISFIKGEALIQLLYDEGLKLNDSPNPAGNTKSSVRYKDSRENSDWAVYADWIHDINQQATDAFLRAIELGIELEEGWLVSDGAVYLWNYNQHHLVAARFKQLVPTFEKVLFGLQKIGHHGIAVLLSRICDVIAKGLLFPWIPKSIPENTEIAQTAPKESRKKTGGKGAAATGAPVSPSLQVAPEAADDLQKALSVCEYALRVTNGSNPLDRIPTAVRHQLLATWVKLKQMLQQQLAPQYGTENEKLLRQQAMSKCLVLLEMLTLNRNKLASFTVLTVEEVCDVVEECEWDDPIVELEVWVRLAKLAHINKNHALVQRCGEMALKLQHHAVAAVKKFKDKQQHSNVWTLLSLACGLLGESLMGTCASNPPARRQALHQFVSSASYGKDAGDFCVVMSACRRWWNAALPFLNSPLERELLKPSLETIITCITRTFKLASSEDQKPEEGLTDLETPWANDLSIIAAIYGLFIQVHIDKEEWTSGLAVADRALQLMPRTHHRLLLFKLRVIMKAKLGKNVETDIAKFRDESEDYVANMWHRVAISSSNCFEQLSAFQKAIEALHAEESKWQKFEYLLQLATWMYSNEFTVADAATIIEWACDTILSISFKDTRIDSGEKEKKKKDKTTRGSSLSPLKSSIKSKAQVVAAELEKAEVWVCPVMDGNLRIQLADPRLNLANLKSARQLEGLVRSHVMMAMVYGSGSKQQRVHSQLAFALVLRIWNISMSSVAVAMKSMPKLDVEGEKKMPGTKTAPNTSEKTKRKGPVDALPTCTAEWAHYFVTDDIKLAFQFDKGYAAINKDNFTCAGLTIFYLLELSEILREIGLNHLSLPVLGLAAVVAEVVLQSSSWYQLVVLKQILVCYELHLDKAAKQKENVLRGTFLDEEEQVHSRQGLDLNDIYKELAKREEDRIRKAAQEEGTVIDTQQKISKNVRSESKSWMGKKLGDVYPSEIWTEKARLLLRLGYLQTCRRLLYEALMVTEYENNDSWRGDIYHVMAELAIREGNNGQALQLINKAQIIGGDELFWKENIYLLIDAITLNNNPSRDDYLKVTKVVQHSIECLDKLLERRPTKKSPLGYMRATLIAHLCFLHLSSHSNAHIEQLSKLEEAENNLHELGFYRKLASIHMKHSEILLDLSKRQVCPHESLLKSIQLLRTSVSNLARLCSDALMIEEDMGVSLPACRELIHVQLHLVTALLEAATISRNEEWQQKLEESAKDEMQRAVDGYIGKEKVLSSSVETMWERERHEFLHQSITILTSLHTNLPKHHLLRAEWLYLYGRCLRLIGGLPSDQQWVPKFSLENKSTSEWNRGVPEEPADEESSSTPLVNGKKFGEEHNQESEKSIRLQGEASEALAQAVNLALQLSELDVVSKASMELLECTAQSDPTVASAYLLLHQSAEFSKQARALLLKACSDQNDSRFAALMHQELWLVRRSVSTGLQECLLRQHILKSLDAFEAWKRIKVTARHLSLMRDLPSSFNYVVLQPSSDKRSLYCAVVCRSKTVVASSEGGKGKSKEKFTSVPSPPRMFISRFEFDWRRHLSSMESFSDFQQVWMSFLLQKEYQNHQIATRKQMLKDLAGSQQNISGNVLENHREEENQLTDKFLNLLEGMEKFFNPMITFINSKLVEPVMSKNNPSISPEQRTEPEQIVLLASPFLHQYPLEYLSCFRLPSFSFAREFSFQLLHSRYNEEVDDVVEKKKGEVKSASKGGKKSANPAAKFVAKDVLGASRNIDQSSVRFVVDPCNDYSQTERYPPTKVFQRLFEVHPTATSRWCGLYGTSSIPSLGQLEDTLQLCSMFIYFGTEKFIGQFPPSKIISTNLKASQLILLLDKVQTHKSFNRQSKINVDKTRLLLEIEKPIETAILLSLSGANSVCLNQLHTSSEDNAQKLHIFVDHLIQGRTVGEAVQAVHGKDTDNEGRTLLDVSALPDVNAPISPEPANVKCKPTTRNLMLFGLPNLQMV